MTTQETIERIIDNFGDNTFATQVNLIIAAMPGSYDFETACNRLHEAYQERAKRKIATADKEENALIEAYARYNLTIKEATLLKCVVTEGMSECCLDHPSEIENQNQTWFNAELMVEHYSENLWPGADVHGIGGVIQSLSHKQLIQYDHGNSDFWFLSTEGIEICKRMWDDLGEW